MACYFSQKSPIVLSPCGQDLGDLCSKQHALTLESTEMVISDMEPLSGAADASALNQN